MIIQSFQGGYDKNLCYLVWCKKTKHAALIDASVEIEGINEYIEAHQLILSKILITHSHHDHIAYIDEWKKIYPLINIYCSSKSIHNKFKFINLDANQVISIGAEFLIALETPGHFYDSMCFWNNKMLCIFTGDTMFVGRTGRTISTMSNIEELYASIYNKLLILDPATIIYPGHHYGHKKTITIKENIILSKFFTCKSLNEFKKVMENFEKNR